MPAAKIPWPPAWRDGPNFIRNGLSAALQNARKHDDSAMSTSSPLNTPASAVCLRNDASVIGLVGLVHPISHFGQLLLAPLFPLVEG